MIHTKKTTQDVLQQEIFRERLAVLVRAGEKLADAWDRMVKLEREIEAAMGFRCGGSSAETEGAAESRELRCALNEKIGEYNRQRERVRKSYYYLIVTREALGLIHHQRLEETYRLPPKKQFVQEA